VYPIVFAVKHGGVAQLEWPNQFVLMYHGVICLYNRANYERFAFATSGSSPGESHAHVRSLPFPPVSPARLLSGDPIDAASIVYVDAYNDNAGPLTHSALCRARNVDNDGAAVIRRTGDCCRIVRLDPDRSRPIRGSSGESALHPANERHREHDFCLREHK